MRKLAIIIPFILMAFISSEKQWVMPSDITKSLSTGNAKALSQHFNSKINLTILSKEGIYSKNQATMVMTDFFKNNKPSKFVVTNSGGKGTDKFAIGRLTTSKAKYRITIYFKLVGNKQLIHQMRIAKDEWK